MHSYSFCAFSVTISLLCDEESRYCIEYRSGSLHDVLTFELIVVASAILAIAGYLRASALVRFEQDESHVTAVAAEAFMSDVDEHDERLQGYLA